MTYDLNERTTGKRPHGKTRAIGEVLGGKPPAKVRRTYQPVRRNSHYAGRCEKRLWRPMKPLELLCILKAAERMDERERRKGERQGPLGAIGLELLRLLCRTVCFRTGRLDPSYEYLERKLRRSHDAVVRAMARLRAHGFLIWERRCEPTENEGRGPQVRQISNAYALLVPEAAAARVSQATPSLPDDHAHAAETAAAELTTMIDALPLGERMRARISDDTLADSLARLGGLLGVV